MNWYYADGGRPAGPVDDAALDELARNGAIRAHTLVWHEGMEGWLSYAAVRGPQPPPLPVLPPPVPGWETRSCAECGRPFPMDQLVIIGFFPVCAVCKPVYIQRLREGGQALGVRAYAGFWVRFVARRIDAVVLGIVVWSVARAIGVYNPGANIGLTALAWLFQLVAGLVYEAYFVSRRGGTLGKLALGLRVVRADGSPVGTGLAVGRFFADWLSQLTLAIGYIMAAFDEEKRALHDRICETRVIYSK